MTLWNWIPPYAEQITVNQVQEKLNEFKQLIPDNFIELEQLNWMCSTQGWKEPVCERYNCLINGEWKQVDVRHTLLEELGLARDIHHPVYISPAVLDKGLDRYLAYNVENETEIFLRKTFTVENLKEDINKLLEKIEELEEKNKELKSKLVEEKGWWDRWINDEGGPSGYYSSYPGIFCKDEQTYQQFLEEISEDRIKDMLSQKNDFSTSDCSASIEIRVSVS